jgi:hypothetical protein
LTFSSPNDIIKSTHAIDAKGGRLPIGIPGRLQIGMHGRLRRYPQAIKYGALSVPAGKVKISWAFDSESLASRELLLKWVEQGGPR